MARRNPDWLVFALVLSLAGAVVGRALTKDPPPPPSSVPAPGLPMRATTPPVGTIPSPALDIAPTPAPTIDQLLDRLDKVRSQKAELERQEKAILEAVRSAVAKQKERLVKSGVQTADPPTPAAPELIPPTGSPPAVTPFPGPAVPPTPN